jgi:hypothetical protein
LVPLSPVPLANPSRRLPSGFARLSTRTGRRVAPMSDLGASARGRDAERRSSPP